MNTIKVVLSLAACSLIQASSTNDLSNGIELPNSTVSLPTDNAIVQTFLNNPNLKCPRSVNLEKLSQATINPNIITRMEKPAEKKSWSFYKNLFISKKRIDDGNWFMRQNRRTLRNTQAQFHVPANIITAIIGVETLYGQRMGNDRLLDSLSTLSFYYPRRANFFQSELTCYLNQSCKLDQEHINLKGSYAGAFGIAQFMPCSYQDYAYSLHSKSPDIMHSSTDAITSIANYLAKKGKWRANQPIINKLNETEVTTLPHEILNNEEITKLTPELCTTLSCPEHAIKIWCPDDCYWLYPNFNSIMTYNISKNYALAVTLLAQSYK